MTTYEIAPCPACRHTEARTLADRDAIRAELEVLWEFHLKRMKTGAPVDQLFDRAIFSQAPPLQVVECLSCGTVYRNPRESAHELVETYEGEAPSAEALESLFEQQLAFYRSRTDKLTALNEGPGDVLEVGSYIGGFLRAATDSGWQARGIDVNANANDFARAHGCNVTEAALDDFATNERFDVVALWNCFDQLPDPHLALQRATELLRPGGLLTLRIPNGAFYAALRGRNPRLVTPVLAWNNIASFPYRHGFTVDSLRLMIEQHDCRIVEVVADTLVPIAGPWSRRWARLEEGMVKATLRLVLPARISPWLEVYARRSGH